MSWSKVDWSQAPDWAVAWFIEDVMVSGKVHQASQWRGFEFTEDRGCGWFEDQTQIAPKFAYRGSVKNSLTLRPASCG